MKHLISLAASVALFTGAAQACERQAIDNSGASAQIILAQAGGSTGGGSTGGGGNAGAATNVDPRAAGPTVPSGTPGAAPAATEPTGAAPAVGSNNTGSGGSNTDGGPIDPRKTPPNAPASAPK
jgi:hypothetical protein